MTEKVGVKSRENWIFFELVWASNQQGFTLLQYISVISKWKTLRQRLMNDTFKIMSRQLFMAKKLVQNQLKFPSRSLTAKVRGHVKQLKLLYSHALEFSNKGLCNLRVSNFTICDSYGCILISQNRTNCLFILLHRSLDTFWPTTGMFPQEFIITFSALMSIGNIKFLSSNGEDDGGKS